jgi:hypothetical protein
MVVSMVVQLVVHLANMRVVWSVDYLGILLADWRVKRMVEWMEASKVHSWVAS